MAKMVLDLKFTSSNHCCVCLQTLDELICTFVFIIETCSTNYLHMWNRSMNLSQYLTNLMHKICFTISFISCLYMFRAHVLIISRSKLHYTASGIITPISRRKYTVKETLILFNYGPLMWLSCSMKFCVRDTKQHNRISVAGVLLKWRRVY